MKLIIKKGLLVISGSKKEERKIEAMAAHIEEYSDIESMDGGDECDEYWIVMTYDAQFMTIEEVRKLYKEAKAA